MVFKIVLSDPKARKAYQKDVDENASGLMGKKIGESVKGDGFGLTGYEVEVTGGSDKEGFPMRKDVEGIGRKKALLSGGSGFHPLLKGQRKRKSVRGNTISEQIIQINMKVTKHGDKPIEELLGVKTKEKPAKEQKAEATKPPEVKEAKPEAKPAEAPKKEPEKPEEAKPA